MSRFSFLIVLLFASTAVADPPLWVAPDGYDHIVPRVQWPIGPRFINSYYEGNNITMRGDRVVEDGPYAAGGREVAEHWRAFASEVRGVFVLRDSLYSQQDHPFEHDPYALMLPPMWLTVAVAEVAAGRTPTPLATPPIEDDASWTALGQSDLFGSYPVSERLHEVVTTPLAGADEHAASRVRNGRQTVHTLAHNITNVFSGAPPGPEEVALLGAELIRQADRKYFGAGQRREHFIPLLVENPLPHELEEGKGFGVPGREIPDEIVTLVRDTVLGWRMLDGDIAVERYDLSEPEQRARATDVLYGIIPRGDDISTGRVWLWVTGDRDTSEPAIDYIAEFRAELRAANVDTGRLRFVSRPVVPIPRGEARQSPFDAEAARYDAAGLPMFINMRSRALRELLL